MKLLFSEYKSDYDNYIFPYAIWAVPEGNERPGALLAKGFLPSSLNLDRYYMCRHIRVDLAQFELSSENRRIMRKGEGIRYELMERPAFDFTPERRQFCKTYADTRFGQDVMSLERLDAVFHSRVCSHIMHFTDDAGKDLGIVVMLLDGTTAAFYYYAFYDLNHDNRNLGMYLMTSIVKDMKERGFEHIYLGSCYSRNAMYKTQFKGVQFWNGFKWSSNLKELKYLIQRDSSAVKKHLLETAEYRELFYPEELR